MDRDPVSIGDLLSAWMSSLGKPVTPEQQERAIRMRRMTEAREMAEFRGVPFASDIYDVALDPLLSGPVVERVRRALAWRNEIGRNVSCCIFLVSPPGLGKTVALTHAVLYCDRSAYYASVERLCAQREWEARDMWTRSRSCSVLALDELGTEADPDITLRLILDRWTNGNATLCATNLDARQLTERYFSGPLGTRLADRMRGQTARGLKGVATFNGPSRRQEEIKRGEPEEDSSDANNPGGA